MLDDLDLIPLKTNPEASPRLQNLRYYEWSNEMDRDFSYWSIFFLYHGEPICYFVYKEDTVLRTKITSDRNLISFWNIPVLQAIRLTDQLIQDDESTKKVIKIILGPPTKSTPQWNISDLKSNIQWVQTDHTILKQERILQTDPIIKILKQDICESLLTRDTFALI